MRRPCAWVIWIAAIGAFASAFFLPATRETQRLACRMLLHCPPAGTKFMRASPGAVVPYLRLSSDSCENLKARIASDPDAYVLGFCLAAGARGFAPAQTWVAHPLARWAAMEEAGQVRFMRPGTRPADPEAIGALALNPGVHNLLATLRLLQCEFPGEGGLWLAEAVVRFEVGQEIEACDAVRTALESPRWTPTLTSFPEYASALLEAQGLPRMEATIRASGMAWMEPHIQLFRDASAAILRLAANAVRTGRQDVADRMLLNWVALAECARDSVDCTVDLHGEAFEELVAAMAGQLGCHLPDGESGSDYAAREHIREQILHDYPVLCSVPGVADQLRLEDLLQQQLAGVWGRRWVVRTELRLVSYRLWSGLPGALSVLLLGLLCAALLAELPFLLAPPLKMGSREIFPSGFLFILLGTFAAMTTVLFLACRSVFGAEDLTVRQVTLLPGNYLLLLLASCIASAAAWLRGLVVWHPGWYRAGCLLILALYLVELCTAAQARHEALKHALLSLSW